MIGRRTMVAGSAATLMTGGRAFAQPAPVRIGYLWIGAPGSDGPAFRGIVQGLLDVGLVEGRNLILEKRYADGDMGRLDALARELVDLRVAVLMTPGAVASRAALAATRTIPIVSTSADPVGAGLAASLARPGGNLTGMALIAGDRLAGKWIELLRQVGPQLKRAAFLVNPNSAVTPIFLAAARSAAAPLGVEIVSAQSGANGDPASALAAAADAGCDCLICSDDALLLSRNRDIVAAADRLRWPAIYGHRQFAESGGLMSYATNIFEVWRRGGAAVDKILKGASPGELPIEQPTRFELVINNRAARSHGLAVPLLLLAQADEVIE
jgi:putative ABC transport system substrate-binding protein